MAANSGSGKNWIKVIEVNEMAWSPSINLIELLKMSVYGQLNII